MTFTWPAHRLSGAESTAGERGGEAETRGSSGSLVAESETEEQEQVPKGSRSPRGAAAGRLHAEPEKPLAHWVTLPTRRLKDNSRTPGKTQG